MRLERMTLRRLVVPLDALEDSGPDVDRQLDIVLVEAAMEGGRTGWGEAALAPGPGTAPETAEQGWIVACKLAEISAGLEHAAACELYARSRLVAPFTVSALTAAVEMAAGHPVLQAAGTVPLTGTVGGHVPTPVEEAVAKRLSHGFTRLRLVLTGEVGDDIGTIRRAVSAVNGRAGLRIDGAQAFTPEAAIELAGHIDPAGVEWLAQPCVAGDWEAAVAVRAASSVPTMIVGFVYTAEDIDLAVDCGAADFVALRLMQAGGLGACLNLAAHARERGLMPAIGGAPQSDLPAWMEACLAMHGADRLVADIANPAAGLFVPSIRVAGGHITVSGDSPAPALDVIEACTEHLLSFLA